MACVRIGQWCACACMCVGFCKGCCLAIFFALLIRSKWENRKSREGAKEEKGEMGKKPPFAFLAK